MDRFAHLYPFCLAVLSVLLFFPGLGARDLWAPVEPRYAEIARVMWERGEWIVPTVNGDLYTDKPILYFWLVLLGAKALGGINEWLVRLPAALSAVGLVLVTYALGRDFFSARAGFLAAVVLATSARVLWEGRWAHTDMPFAFFFALSLYFWARAHFRRGSPGEFPLACGLMGLATLTKGLIGVVLPALIIGGLLIVRRDWRSVLTWRTLSGAAVFLLVTAPWFAQVTRATGGEWLRESVWVHHVQRYTAGPGHEEPLYYYLVNFPGDIAPWTIFLLPAILAYRNDRGALREPAALFFALWFAAIFLFFSFSVTKRALYLLPLLPPVALGLGLYFDRLIGGEVAPGLFDRWAAYLLFGAFLLGGLSLPPSTWHVERELVWLSLVVSLVMMAGGGAGLAGARRDRYWVVVFAVAVTTLVTMVWASLFIFPFFDRYKSAKPFALEVKKLLPASEPLYVYADTMNDFNFYTEREVIRILSSPSEVEDKAAAGAYHLLVRERDLRREAFSTPLTIEAESRIGDKKWYLARVGHARGQKEGS